MHINPNWRILTVGDGDLSFSHALLTHYHPKQLTATVFDDLVIYSDLNKCSDRFIACDYARSETDL